MDLLPTEKDAFYFPAGEEPWHKLYLSKVPRNNRCAVCGRHLDITVDDFYYDVEKGKAYCHNHEGEK